MSVVLNTSTLSRFGLDRIFQIAKEASFDGIEISVTSNLDTTDNKYLKELTTKYKLPIKAFSVPPGASRKNISHVIELAEKLEVKVVTIYPTRLMDLSGASWLQKVIPLAYKEHKVNLCVINVPSSSSFGILPDYSYSSLIDLKKLNNVTLDTSNLVTKKEDLIRALDLLGKSLKHVQLSNVHQGQDHYILNEGILPIESFLTKLKDIDYSGTISLKIRGSYLTEGDVEILTMELKKMKEFVEKYYKK